MAVVNLPEDRRWSDLGASLGGFASQVVGAFAQRQVDQGVATVLNDDTIPPDKKMATVVQRFGKPGMDTFTTQLKSRLLQQQIGLTGSETTGKDIANAQALQKGPMDIALLKGQLAGQATKNQLGQVDLGTAQAQAPYAGPIAGATAREKEAGAQKTQLEADTLAQQLEAQRNFLLDPKSSLEAQGITDPKEQAQVYNAAPKQRQAVIDQILQQKRTVEAKRTEPKIVTTETARLATNASGLAASLTNFYDSMEDDLTKGKATGTLSGAPLQAWLIGHGFPVSDPGLAKSYENQIQGIMQQATSSGGFISSARINLAKLATPNLSKSPIPNIMALGAVADEKLAELQTDKARYSKTLNYDTTMVDQAIDKMQKIKDRTNALEAYHTKSGENVITYKGDLVDLNLKVLNKSSEQLDVGGGHKVLMSDILADARAKNITPQQRLAEIRANLGYKP